MATRIFQAKDRFGATVDFELKVPTPKEEHESNMQYRIAYAEALKQGVPPREVIRRIMSDHDFWDDDDDSKLKDILRDLAELELDLRLAEQKGDLEKTKETAVKLADKRRQMWKYFVLQQSPFMNSCESFAESVKLESQMAACTVIKASQKRYWDSYKDYIVERDCNVDATVAATVQSIQLNILTEERLSEIKEYPEQKWIENFKEHFLEEAGLAEAKAELLERVKKSIDANEMETDANNPEASNT